MQKVYLLAQAKVVQMESAANMEVLYARAIESMQSYQGIEMPEED